MSVTIQATQTFSDQDLLDLFTCAMEGGCSYWASVREYHWQNADGSEDLLGFRAVLVDYEDDRKARHEVTRDTIIRGVQRIAQGDFTSGGKPPSPEYLGRLRSQLDPEVGDAGTADAILQVGLFGDIQYG